RRDQEVGELGVLLVVAMMLLHPIAQPDMLGRGSTAGDQRAFGLGRLAEAGPKIRQLEGDAGPLRWLGPDGRALQPLGAGAARARPSRAGSKQAAIALSRLRSSGATSSPLR